MAYTKQQWIDNQTSLDASHMNHIEDGISSIENDLANLGNDLTNLGTALQTEIDSLGTTINELDSNDIAYDNTTSELQSTNVQGAINEIDTKLDSIGIVYSNQNENVSIPHATIRSIAEITLTAGVYIIVITAQFGIANSTGIRTLSISRTENIHGRWQERVDLNAASAGNTKLNVTTIAEISEETTFYNTISHNAGTALPCHGYIVAVKIA